MGMDVWAVVGRAGASAANEDLVAAGCCCSSRRRVAWPSVQRASPRQSPREGQRCRVLTRTHQAICGLTKICETY